MRYLVDIFGTKKYSKSYKAIAKIKEKKRTLKAKSNVLKLLKLKKRNTNPKITSAVKFCTSIFLSQNLHLPFKYKKLIIGIRSMMES